MLTMGSSTKRKSVEMEDAYPSIEHATPTNTPSKKRMRITRSQKQTLMDNLQLESMFVSQLSKVLTDILQSRKELVNSARSTHSKHKTYDPGSNDASIESLLPSERLTWASCSKNTILLPGLWRTLRLESTAAQRRGPATSPRCLLRGRRLRP